MFICMPKKILSNGIPRFSFYSVVEQTQNFLKMKFQTLLKNLASFTEAEKRFTLFPTSKIILQIVSDNLQNCSAAKCELTNKGCHILNFLHLQ